ncbi:TPA: adenylate/guanylate cyclase [Klebsiella quasipneumoniae]
MNNEQKVAIEQIINSSLDQAEAHWRNGGYKIALEMRKSHAQDSRDFAINESLMPGLPPIYEGQTIIGEFIALVADMRDSTNHLLQAISPKKADISDLQRVFYETSALLPSLAKVVSFHDGKTTEYLGDGILAFFLVDEEDKTDAMYRARRAANDIIGELRPLLNRIIFERYRLPEIDLGVGMGISKAIVSLVGLPKERQVKAFGECVFRATKLSSGRNEICVDTNLHAQWPTSKNGTLRFRLKSFGSGDKAVSGYLLEPSKK